MPEIIFQINLQHDASNYVRVAKLDKHHFGANLEKIASDIPVDLMKQLKILERPDAKILAEKYLFSQKNGILPGLEANKERLVEYFDKYGQAIFEQLEKITNQPMCADKFYCSFTTLTSCPYNHKTYWFMVSSQRVFSRQITGILHEILHIQFHYYYEDYCKKQGLNEQQFQDLKEALTFLLNEPVFAEFNFGPDRGYINHQTLRVELKKLYDQDKKFSIFLDKAIKLVKGAY